MDGAPCLSSFSSLFLYCAVHLIIVLLFNNVPVHVYLFVCMCVCPSVCLGQRWSIGGVVSYASRHKYPFKDTTRNTFLLPVLFFLTTAFFFLRLVFLLLQSVVCFLCEFFQCIFSTVPFSLHRHVCVFATQPCICISSSSS